MVTISDKKIGVDANGDGVIDYYNADVITANDYYPFGMQMPGRKFAQANSSYRYGFNGKENDKDISEGAQDYGLRIYDSRLGRFLSMDPLSSKYPFYTPYSFAGNKPIQCIDLDGAEDDIPFLQSSAFDRIEATGGVSYVRGKRGEGLGSELHHQPDAFENFLRSISPIWMEPMQPAPYVAQAINFADAVGSLVINLDKENSGERGGSTFVRESNAIFAGNSTLYVQISGYSEVGRGIRENLRAAYGLKNLSDAEISDYISDVRYIFKPTEDYSFLFWKKEGGMPNIGPMLNQIGPIAIPIPVTAPPILLPPLGGGAGAVNTPAGSLTVSVQAISQEMAATLAPGILKANEKKLEGKGDLEKAQEQLEGIEKAQTNLKQNKVAGQKKQSKINSIKKSEQRLKNALKNIKNLGDAE